MAEPHARRAVTIGYAAVDLRMGLQRKVRETWEVTCLRHISQHFRKASPSTGLQARWFPVRAQTQVNMQTQHHPEHAVHILLLIKSTC